MATLQQPMATRESQTATCCEIILAILLPPLGVFFRYACGIEFWICLLLTILGYIPGILYAIYVIVR
ncbi:hydrophobic protein [Klebsormidium nitens]|uniref:Hydrophobic protein n=1 Tax=Klebsormidium nitens TaxID=105231 RepID=A0A1Y1IA26_KLENI|nr:hydrophobic protein [Klebsormidium nitens]|eukprot:GAQ85971.1 hydrophobic protein [Klebsormidium nitens]